MDRAVLTVIPENIITVWLMVLLLLGALALGRKLFGLATGRPQSGPAPGPAFSTPYANLAA